MTANNEALEDGWVAWHGGECPASGQYVEVEFRSGRKGVGQADAYYWYHDLISVDIIAYRIASPAVPSTPEGEALGTLSRLERYVSLDCYDQQVLEVDGSVIGRRKSQYLIELLEDADRALASLRSSMADLREYAHSATKVITGLAGGGSELFSKEIDGIFTADLAFCARRIEESKETSRRKEREALTTAVEELAARWTRRKEACSAAQLDTSKAYYGGCVDAASDIAAAIRARNGGPQ